MSMTGVAVPRAAEAEEAAFPFVLRGGGDGEEEEGGAEADDDDDSVQRT